MSIYLAIGLVAALYVSVLFLFNRIPHVSIKSLGWFCIKHVNIDLGGNSVHVRKLRFRLNLFKRKDSPYKIINVEFHDVVVHIKQSSHDKPSSSSPSPSIKQSSNLHDRLTFHISKRIYDWLFVNRLINQFSIDLIRCSIFHHAAGSQKSVFLDYVRLENSFAKDGSNKLIANIFSGNIQCGKDCHTTSNESNGTPLFRNLTLCLKWDTVFFCPLDDPSKITAKIGNFSINLSLSQLNVAINDFKTPGSLPEEKSLSSTHKSHDSSGPNMDELKAVYDLFNSIEIRLEDFTIHDDRAKASFSTFVTSFARVQPHGADKDAKFTAHLTSLKLYHLDTKCFELPSGSASSICDPSKLLLIANATKQNVTILNSLVHSFALTTTITLTNPTLDVYYDQLDLLLSLAKRDAEYNPSSNPEVHDSKAKLNTALAVFRTLSAKFVMVDTSIVFHLPQPNHDEFHRDSVQNLKVQTSISSFTFKAFTKHDRKPTPADVHPPISFRSFLKLRNFSLDAADNLIQLSKLSFIFGYSPSTSKLSVGSIVKNVKLKSVNESVFHIVRQLRNRQITHMNEMCALLQKENTDIEVFPDNNDSSPRNTVYKELFEILPAFLSTIKCSITSIQADIICKDRLPSFMLYDDELGKDVDLGDFRRGVSLKLADLSFLYKRAQEVISTNVKSIQMFTLSEYITEYIPDFDQVADPKFSYDDDDDDDNFDASTLESAALDEQNESDLKKVKKVLYVRDVSISNVNREKDPNKLVTTIPEINGRFDIFLVWSSIYAKTLLDYFAPTVEREYSKEQASALGKDRSKVKVDLYIESLSVVSRLPNSVDFLLEIDSLDISDCLVLKKLAFKYIRLHVVHPSTKLWARLLTLTNARVYFMHQQDLNEWTIDVDARAIRLNIPHQFLLYTIIDNTITFAKAVRQIEFNFKNLSLGNGNYSRIMPEAKPAPSIPNINIKSSVVGLTIENDIFENELGYIFELGILEQKERLKKLSLFEEKAEEIKFNIKRAPEDLTEASPHETLAPPISTASAPRYNSPLRNVFSDIGHTGNSTFKDKLFSKHKKAERPVSNEVFDDDEGYTEEEADEKIANALQILQADFATSWVNKFRKFRSVKISSWKRRSDRVWGEDVINPLMLDNYEMQNYAPGPCLMGVILKDVDLSVSKACINNVHDFLYEHGKGQRQLDYSILIPMFIDLKARSLYVFLRDYALPLVSFPQNRESSKPVINLRGNVVINEKLVTRKEEMRYIFVPFSPAAPSRSFDHDCFYSVFVPRTLTPVKFMMNLECDIDTNRSCILSWCKSYQAALSATMVAFDNFTKPEIDDSPLGWWDKASLILHGRVVFNFANELCLHIKSSTNPYDMIGRASGFVFCWKNNVSLKFNDGGRHDELIKLDSDDFLLAIPNYSLAERGTWSLFYDELESGKYDFDSEASKFKKKVMKLTSDERVRWKLGLLFERNATDSKELSHNQERTNSFKPHYDVVVTNPAFDWHPDSYTDFRSDYLHLAISVSSSSTKGNCFNAAYLSPETFHYFFYWWESLTEHISLPIKQGPLFKTSPVDKSHIKMSPHLFTVKYQLFLEPLLISHIYMHSTKEEIEGSYRVAFTGLKGRFSKCLIDLHQRKELVRYVNEKLNINSSMLHLKLNEGEIAIDEADIRFLNAVFEDKSLRGYLANYLSGKTQSNGHIQSSRSDPRNDGTKFYEWLENEHRDKNDIAWVDPDDFVEIEVRDTLSPYPKIEVTPFLYSPKFTYFREFSLEENGPHPFGHEPAHDCLLGHQRPDEAQGILLKERMNDIKNLLSVNEEILAKLEYSNDPEFKHDMEKVKTDIKIGNEKLDVVERIYSKMTGSEFSSSDSDDQPSSMSRVQSRPLSVYSNQTSIGQIKEVSNMHSNVSEFHNRFIVHNMQLKWDNKTRDLFMEYIQKVSDRKSHVYYMSKKAVDLVESVLKDSETNTEDKPKEELRNKQEYKNGEDVISAFDEILSELADDKQDNDNKYLIKLIHPQIQLVSEKAPDSCVLVTTRDLEIRIIAVMVKGTSDIISESAKVSSLIETRYGVLFKDSHIFVFKKDESTISHPDFEYGVTYEHSNVNWPPWVECEVCYDSSWVQSELVAERNSMALILTKPNFLLADNQNIDQGNEITVHLAKVVLNANSIQYSSIFYVITDLLVHGKTTRDEFVSRLDKVIALSDTSDFEGLDQRVKNLQEAIRSAQSILLRLDSHAIALSSEETSQIGDLEIELERMKMELVILMRGLSLRSSKHQTGKHESRIWNIFADQIIWHLLDEDREPFIDFAIAEARFSRVDAYDGSNVNQLIVKMIQGFNLQSHATYPELLRPCLELKETKLSEDEGDKPIINVEWTLLEPVGGIRVVQHAKLDIEPLKVQLDYDTSIRLFEYVFPKDADSAEGDVENEPNESEETADGEGEGKTLQDILTKIPFKNFMSKSKPSNESVLTENSGDALSLSPSSYRSDSLSGRYSFSEETSSGSERLQRPKTAFSSPKSSKDSDLEDDISLIMSRSSRYMSIVEIEVCQVNMSVSFKAPKHLNILDIHNLNLTIPTLKYKNKMWSGEDFIVKLRKDIIKVILNHSGKILSNKFKPKKRHLMSEPLKQISNYASYMTLQDLQSEGRSRDAAKVSSNGHQGTHHHPRHHQHHHHSLQRSSSARSNNVGYNNILDNIESDGILEESDGGPEELDEIHDEDGIGEKPEELKLP